jgi:hypothetical protein
MDRFDIITSYNGDTFIIDRQHKLPALPLGVCYPHLSDADKDGLKEWLYLLNSTKEE